MVLLVIGGALVAAVAVHQGAVALVSLFDSSAGH